MSFARLVNFTKKITPPTIGFVLLLALAANTSFSDSRVEKESSSKISNEETTGQTKVLSETEESEDVGGVSDNESSEKDSSGSSVSVSVETNTTSNETTGSSTIEVTQNGETKRYSSDGGNFSVNVNGEDDEDVEVKINSRIRSNSNVKIDKD